MHSNYQGVESFDKVLLAALAAVDRGYIFFFGENVLMESPCYSMHQ